jgi:DNA polymerase III alpha subunit (gram-positive type)
MQSVYTVIIGVDTETTGTKPWKNGIIQIGAKVITKTGKEIARFNEHCNPGDVEYTEEALEINHMTIEQIKKARPIRDVLLEFVPFMNKYLEDRINKATVVGNNFGFDTWFLQYAFDKHIPELDSKTKWMFRRIDELKGVARTVLPETEHLNQGKLGNLLGIPNTNPHDAMGDIEQMLGIYCELMKINYQRILAYEKEKCNSL